jgi:hypothetical protein
MQQQVTKSIHLVPWNLIVSKKSRNSLPFMELEGLLLYPPHESMGWDVIVGTATGSTVWGANPNGGRDFPYLSRPVLGPTQPPKQWIQDLSWVVKWLGPGVDHPTPPSAEVKERVELYLYSPSGPSWPVLGPALPLFTRVHHHSLS